MSESPFSDDGSSIEELAARIEAHPDATTRIEGLAANIRALATGEGLARTMVEDAANNRASGLAGRFVYFEEYFDSPRKLDPEFVQEFMGQVRAYANREYPEKRTHFHRSGSDPYDPISDGHDHYVALTVD